MDISYHTLRTNLDTSRGYGYAGYQIVTALQRLGHRVPFDHKNAPVQVSFTQPEHYHHYDHQYKIGYTPWESTILPGDWVKIMNTMDEVWATSQWTADTFKDAGVNVPIHTYRHGLDPVWTPHLRERGDKLKFLHVGEPAPRKGGQYALDAFIDAFGERDDVHLTIKAHHQHFVRSWQKGAVVIPEWNNVTLNKDNLSNADMVKLFHEHDVLVYPSWGEGFGLIPLQALGTGMPTICTGAWAPYKRYLNDLKLPSQRVRSTWTYHPGNVYQPDYDALVDLYRKAESDFFSLSHQFFKQSDVVHNDYNWDKLTTKAFAHIVEMFA